MFELHVRETLGDFDRRVHVTEAGGEHHVMRLSQLRDHTLSVRAFRYAFNKGGFNLVTVCFFDRQTAYVVLVSPAAVRNGTDVDKAYF